MSTFTKFLGPIAILSLTTACELEPPEDPGLGELDIAGNTPIEAFEPDEHFNAVWTMNDIPLEDLEDIDNVEIPDLGPDASALFRVAIELGPNAQKEPVVASVRAELEVDGAVLAAWSQSNEGTMVNAQGGVPGATYEVPGDSLLAASRFEFSDADLSDRDGDAGVISLNGELFQ